MIAIPPDGQASSARPPFRAVLTPHRSLSQSGFVVVMVAISTVSFVAGVVFLMLGAWPVFAFFGLDVLLVYVAFKMNYRSGRAYETIELSDEKLTLTRVDPRGRAQAFEFNPYWVKVQLTLSPDGRNDLSLALRDRVLPFGRFLTNDEREELASALNGELLAAKGGRRI